MKINIRKYIYLGLSLALMLITLLGRVAAQEPAPAIITTSIRYTLTAPANTNWTAKDFDDSAWTKTEDAASIPAAVAKDGEVWIRIRCDLPWELINNTYAKVTGAGPVEVYVNGKQACQTKILSCTVKTELRPNDAIRVVSSDGASSPSTHFFDPFAFTGELSFVPNSAKPAANFDRQFKSLVASLKAGGYKKVVVTGHANLLGNKPTANSTKLATARGEFVAKKLRLALPGVEILVVNRSVFSPLFSGSNLRNIRAEVYAVN